MDIFDLKKIIFLSLSLLAIVSCKKNENECADNVVCTEVYVTIGVQVLDKEQRPILLDRLSVILSDTDEPLPEEYLNFPVEDGNYIIIGDSALKKLKKTGSKIQVRGTKALNLLFKEDYVIGHDCCHVIKISGKDTIIVE